MKVKEFGPGTSPQSAVWIGIDQSYSGFAITALDDKCAYKTWVAKLEGGGPDRLDSARYFLWKTLNGLGTKNVVDVAMEGYAYGSVMSSMLGELGGVVKLTLWSTLSGAGKYPLIVPPTTLKKFITGKGTGVQKNQILLHTYKKWGVEMLDDNACDSYGLARIAFGKPTLAYEKEVWEKLQDVKYREA